MLTDSSAMGALNRSSKFDARWRRCKRYFRHVQRERRCANCPRAAEACVHALLLIDGLLIWTQDPERAERDAAVVQTLSVKPWQRLLAAIDSGLAATDPETAAHLVGTHDFVAFASKLWRPRRDNANGGRNHADFLENLRAK